MLKFAPVVLAISVAGCAGGQGLEVFEQFESASKVIAQGEKIKKQAAEKLAVGFDGYCRSVPGVARTFVRNEVNQALAAMGSKFRANDFCGVAE